MQELVLCRIRTFVCSCSTDSSQLFFGRHDILVRQTVDAICSLIVMNCIGKSLMIFESCKVWCSHLQITFLTHFMWHVPLLFMYFWTRLFWMLRFSKDVQWACRPFLQTSSPGFSQSVPKRSRRYSWGCKWSASWPVARILPKPSKGFAKARPIIACDHCWHSRLQPFWQKECFRS